MEKFNIIDLDNCISDDLHRHHFLDSRKNSLSRDEQLKQYHSLCHLDKFVWHYGHPLPKNIVIFTGRPYEYYNMTVDWLRKNNVKFESLWMRPCGNYMPQPELKELFLKNLFGKGEYHYIERAYDDRQDVLEMYWRNNINASLKRINEYENR